MSIYHELATHGQSLWLDYIDRNLLVNGGLKILVSEGLRGVTSNPTIFHKALTSTVEYDNQIRELLAVDHEIDEMLIYHWITLQDVQMAADILRGVYDSTHGEDGYVSLEVPPDLAYDTEATVKIAQNLWNEIKRPNLMIKVPATEEGLPAIERLIAGGINVNVTLLFSVSRYQQVVEAYLRGLAANPDPGFVSSVASFFVSRIDTKVDQALEQVGTPEALALRGKIAIACAKLAYQHYQKIIRTEAFKTQHEHGARAQRLLWASTGTKNPNYSDVLYIEQLIGPNTVNTVPPSTLDAFTHHGEVQATLEADVDSAKRDIATLATLGINLDEITQQLENEGVASFLDSYQQLLAVLNQKRFSVAKDFVGSES